MSGGINFYLAAAYLDQFSARQFLET
ncbi:Zinc-binding ribosomal protein L44, partial [Cryptosporidium meleagridis]